MTSHGDILCADWLGGICEGGGMGFWPYLSDAELVVAIVIGAAALWVGVYVWANLRYWWGER